ncbi:MAG: hypothetical protein U5Q03_12730 [Bacteroidota bacterium]|nr:hypothetical protein [Bacteroidota bacterium]
MKKLGIIVSILMLFVLVGFSETAPPPSGYYVGGIEWDESNCSCAEPIRYDVRIVIIKISDQSLVSDSGWQLDVSEPYSYTNTTDNIGLDCGDPCYTVVVYVRIKDSSGTCCSGYSSDNVSGETLVGGSYAFPNEIVLN